jgi:hypothetical protein
LPAAQFGSGIADLEGSEHLASLSAIEFTTLDRILQLDELPPFVLEPRQRMLFEKVA